MVQIACVLLRVGSAQALVMGQPPPRRARESPKAAVRTAGARAGLKRDRGTATDRAAAMVPSANSDAAHSQCGLLLLVGEARDRIFSRAMRRRAGGR
ncbi:hypothetical protein JK363_35325 [Streptomyces sp. 205]|uniref:Secreted protein n=1 Tax=Streptomyces coffeae TaxID=621382 RepID=A0ABS1NPC4_9ACTN|nr:hypothetical protein [Streptomyces coffeae]